MERVYTTATELATADLPRLEERHRRELKEGSGISADVIAERGYRTTSRAADLEGLGFAAYQRRVPAMVVPLHSPTGKLVAHQTKPDKPRKDKKGKAQKYETPHRTDKTKPGIHLDVHPRNAPKMGDASVPLWIVEGVKKADSLASRGECAVALQGVDGWRSNGPLPEWNDIELRGRQVFVAYDSDASTNHRVRQALSSLVSFLQSRGAIVRVVYIPSGTGGEKVGVDDFLVAGGTVQELKALAEGRLRRRTFNLTDMGNAERLVDRHGGDLLYCKPLGGWFFWDGRRWKPDDTGEVERRAKETVRSIYREAGESVDDSERKALADHARRSEARSRIEAMIALAHSESGIPVLPDQLDSDPWALNCENGTVDLQTGQLREHDRADLITRLAPVAYDSEAEAPRFERYLREVLLQESVVGFVRRYAGYSLTGSTRERIFAILHGTGKNGKTTLVELLQDVAGDYATTTDPETILARRHQGVGNDVAALKGARFVAAAEVERGRALAESKIKALTGSDTISARFLYAEPFTFKPEFKLWLSTNNKPEIGGTDDAIWDRIRLIPFTERFDGDRQDPDLPDKLREERPGVLAWMVRGGLEWLREGLGEPEEVRDATEAYRAEMDVLADFIGDRCVEHPDAWCRFSDLFEEYEEWCRESGETAKSKRQFGAVLRDRGFSPDKGAQNVSIRRGMALRDNRDPDPPDGAEVTQASPASDPGSAATAPKGEERGNQVTERKENGNLGTPCKTGDSEEKVTQGYSETTNFAEKPLVRELSQNGVTNGNSVTSVVSPPLSSRRLTHEEAERVKGLIAEGMAPALARAQVLGEGAELGCA